MSYLYGFDGSSWQGTINLDNVRIDFGIIKATEGIDYVNPFYAEQIGALRKDNDLVGHYHFAHPESNSPESEAHYFLSKIDIKATDIIILDWETNYSGDIDLWCFTFLENVKNHLNGLKGGLYLNKSEESTKSWSRCVNAGYFLMLADYDNTGLAHPWPFIAMQQTTDKGSVNGIAGNVDLDTFFGDKNAWDKYGYNPPAPAIDPRDAQISQLNTIINQLNQKISDLNTLNSTKDSSINDLNSKVNLLTNQISSDEAQISDLNQKCETYLSQIQTSIQSGNNQIEKINNDNAQEIKDLNIQISNLESEFSYIRNLIIKDCQDLKISTQEKDAQNNLVDIDTDKLYESVKARWTNLDDFSLSQLVYGILKKIKLIK